MTCSPRAFDVRHGPAAEPAAGVDFDTSVWRPRRRAGLHPARGSHLGIYNEVLQFFLIVFGFAPLVFLGSRIWAAGRSHARLTHVATAQGFAPQAWSSTWRPNGRRDFEPMASSVRVVMDSLRAVVRLLCTDFLVVQRAMAAHSMSARVARR